MKQKTSLHVALETANYNLIRTPVFEVTGSILTSERCLCFLEMYATVKYIVCKFYKANTH